MEWKQLNTLETCLYLSYKSQNHSLHSMNIGKAPSAEDLKFLNIVKTVQNYALDTLTKLAVIHLSLQGYSADEIESFELALTNPSVIDEEERLEILSTKVDVATSMLDSGLFSQNYVYNEIFSFSGDDIETMRKEIIEDRKDLC